MAAAAARQEAAVLAAEAAEAGAEVAAELQDRMGLVIMARTAVHLLEASEQLEMQAIQPPMPTEHSLTRRMARGAAAPEEQVERPLTAPRGTRAASMARAAAAEVVAVLPSWERPGEHWHKG